MIDWENAKGYLKGEERRILYYLAKSSPVDSVFVNIGVEYGASVVCLHAGNPEALIYAIDINTSKYAGPKHENIQLVEQDSFKFFLNGWTGIDIDILFVDGDHSEHGVAMDSKWTQNVRLGGYVIFHDCYDWLMTSHTHQLYPGINKAVSDWYAATNGWLERDPVATCRVFQRLS